METIYYTGIDTPWGKIWAAASEKGLVQLNLSSGKEAFLKELKARTKAELIEDPSRFGEMRSQLHSYFRHERTSFDIPLDLRGTPFQVDVWRGIYDVQYGQLTSYGRIAKAIGRPNAVRAVGNAVGDNPISLVIPCHRVVSSNGGIGGFGGGLPLKRRMLTHEGVLDGPDGTPERNVDLRQFFHRK